jgi:hypothetical protein
MTGLKYPRITIITAVLFFTFVADFTAAKIAFRNRGGEINKFRTPDGYFHHGLLPNRVGTENWGDAAYKVYTNSLGFRDREIRNVSRKATGRRILFIGDSFAEGVGIPYEKTFIGILGRRYTTIEMLNAGAVSYSPKLYYLRTRYLLEEVKLEFDELYVFMDLSDIQDETIYKQFRPNTKEYGAFGSVVAIKKGLKRNSIVLYYLDRVKDIVIAKKNREIIKTRYEERARWTYDEQIYEKWGREGIVLAKQNMRYLADLCKEHAVKLTIVVYPWPQQIRQKDLNSKQVVLWRKFAEENSAGFIDCFPDFIDEALNPDTIIDTYFIAGDIHWNEAGHQLVAQKIALKIPDAEK